MTDNCFENIQASFFPVSEPELVVDLTWTCTGCTDMLSTVASIHYIFNIVLRFCDASIRVESEM
jgi:hypothetical protein